MPPITTSTYIRLIGVIVGIIFMSLYVHELLKLTVGGVSLACLFLP